MADIRDLVEKWDGHTGNEVEKFLKQEIGKKQETLKLGAGLGWDEGKLAVKYGKGLTSDSQQGLRVDVGSLVSGGRGLNFYGDGTMGVSVSRGLKIDSCEVVVDYGTGLKLSGNTLVLDKSVLPDVPSPEDIWSKSIDSTLEFGEGGDTLGVSLANIAGDGLEKSGDDLQVLLGTEAPVRATCGGLGFTNAGGLSLALGNKVFTLGPNGLGISTSETVTDAGGKLAVKYGKGLTSDSQQGLRVDVGSLVSGVGGLKSNSDGTMGVNVGAGLKVASCAVVVDYGTGLKLLGNTLVLDKSVLPDVPNPEDIWSKSIDSTLEFGEGGDTLGVSLANIAGDGLEKSGDDLQVLLGTEAPVRATCGGLGFTNAGGLALALGNKVFSLGPNGLGISTSETVTDAGGKLAVKYGKGLTSDSKQGLRVDVGSLVSGGRGLNFYSDGTMGVSVSRGLKIDSCEVVVDYGTGLKVVNNKLDVDTSKIAGAGIDLDSAYKTLTIGTKAAQELAGKGLVADGSKMKVKYGSGLTTNSCGGLIVDAGNLSVKNADMLAGQELGYKNGKIPLYVPFPNYSSLISMGYLRNDYESIGYPTNEYLKAICKWAIATYPDRGDILMGNAIPSSAGFLILSMYSASGYDATSLLPRYCTGWYMALGGNSYMFHTVEYVWSIREMVSFGDTVARATADAKGNNIADTYLKSVYAGEGIANGSFNGQLRLPFLTASVTNGAVDGIKNNKQRVLELSCGAIQIKLSTGLAIDDNGYLYIQDKYVTK